MWPFLRCIIIKVVYLCLKEKGLISVWLIWARTEWKQKYVKEAFDTNWVVPLGPNVNGFEKDLEEFVNQNGKIACILPGQCEKWKIENESFICQTSESSIAYINGVSEALFKVGMCLPAGPYVSDDDVRYIVETIKANILWCSFSQPPAPPCLRRVPPLTKPLTHMGRGLKK